MFKFKKAKKATAPVVREFRFIYRGETYSFFDTHVSGAKRQIRENMSAQAEREAFLVEVV